MIKHKNLYINIILIAISIVFGACKQQKLITSSAEKNITYNELKTEINNKSGLTNKFSIKGIKISIDDNSSLINLKANMLVSKDSAILLSLSNALGIEVSRILLQPDSIKLIDRINKTFHEGTFIEMSNRYNLPVNYYILQSILFSNYSQIFNTCDFVNSSDTINSKYNNYETRFILNENESTQIILLLDDKNYNLNQAILKSKNQNIKVEYISYKDYSSIFFPEIIELEIKSKKTNLRLAIKYGSVSFKSSSKIKLDIPKNYYISSIND